METSLQDAIFVAQRFLANRTDTSLLVQLENKFDSLNAIGQELASTNSAGVIENDGEQTILIEWFNYCHNLLTLSETLPIGLLSKVVRFLSIFAWHNLSARRYFQTDLNLASVLCLCVFQCGDRHNVFCCQCLRLYQMLTYEAPMSSESYWSNNAPPEFIAVLLRTICLADVNSSDTDQLRYSMGSLNNLCVQSPSTRQLIKRTELKKELHRSLTTLLQHSSTDVVVNCLSLIFMLDESLKEKVFISRNLTQTFQCAFNVLMKGDNFMARHYAADLFMRLIDQPSIRQTLAGYKYLDDAMGGICSLLVKLDMLGEPIYKLCQLLLKFCKTDNLRRSVCFSIMQAGPVGDRLISPLVAIMECTRIAVEQCPFPDFPSRAMKLLRYVLETVTVSGHRLADYASTDVLIRLIEDCLKTTIETGKPHVAQKCKRIVQCLRLASIASRDDAEFRTDLLEVITPELCAHLSEFQMLSNPIASASLSAAIITDQQQKNRPSWHGVGAQLLFTLMEFLRLQEIHSSGHRDQHRRLLKDIRVVPFLAYGITSSNKKMVQQAFAIALTIAKFEEFPHTWFSELVAQNVRRMRSSDSTISNGDLSNDEAMQKNNYGKAAVNTSFNPSISAAISDIVQGKTDLNDIDNLISKMKASFNIEDPKISQIMAVYEKKIAVLEAKENQLQTLLQAKTNVLQQGEKVLNQYRYSRKEVDEETAKLRVLLRESELKREQSIGQVASIAAENEKLRMDIKQLEKCVDDSRRELEIRRETEYDYQSKLKIIDDALIASKREIESEKEMHDVLRKHYDSMKQNFDTTYNKLGEAEQQLKQMTKVTKEYENSMSSLMTTNEELRDTIRNKLDEIVVLETSLEKLQDTLQTLEKDKKLLQRHVAEVENELAAKNALVRNQEQTIQKNKEDIENFSTLMQAMHKLSSSGVRKN